MGHLAALGECPLAFGDNRDRLCAWCGNPLTGRARRWCSSECGMAYADNHSWSCVRPAALKRDGHKCVRCGATSWSDGTYTALEVNHKDPVLGKHARAGCWHHLDGVETLCRPCHLDETARQFGHQRIGDAVNQMSLLGGGQ